MTRLLWTADRVAAEAKKYRTRTEFSVESGSAYAAARKLGILNEVCDHMIAARKGKAPGSSKWTLAMLANEAKKYRSRSEFQQNSLGAYTSAYKRKLLDNICSHMAARTREWSFAEVQQEARKHEFRSDFQRSNLAAYTWARRRGLIDEICAHMKNRTLPRRNLQEVTKVAKKYFSRSDFHKNELGAYTWAHKNNLLDDVCSHMESNKPPDWTEGAVRREARRYKTKTEFHKTASGAYNWAIRNGIFDAVCAHMDCLRRPRWTDDELRKEALKYGTRVAFNSSNHGAYKTAWKRGILDSICTHMERSFGDRDTVYIWKVPGVKHLGLPVYKIGLTSWRRGAYRIREVSKMAGVKSEVIAFTKVNEAPILEKILHELGEHAPITDSDGKTEFRAMNNDELETALQFIQSEEIAA